MDPLIPLILSASTAIRYVAVHRDGQLSMAQRPGLSSASASESDRYEELLVNPTVLGLTGARGDIDCGGREYVLIRYGHFFQLVHPLAGGHVSIAIEPEADPLAVLAFVKPLLSSVPA